MVTLLSLQKAFRAGQGQWGQSLCLGIYGIWTFGHLPAHGIKMSLDARKRQLLSQCGEQRLTFENIKSLQPSFITNNDDDNDNRFSESLLVIFQQYLF